MAEPSHTLTQAGPVPWEETGPAQVLGLLLALVLYSLDGGCGRLRVEVTAALDQGPVVLVEFIEQGDPGGDVQPRDVLVGDTVQVMDSSQYGSMRATTSLRHSVRGRSLAGMSA